MLHQLLVGSSLEPMGMILALACRPLRLVTRFVFLKMLGSHSPCGLPQNGGQLEVIGECYVYGIMDGQLLPGGL
jgi:hypothetical protein